MRSAELLINNQGMTSRKIHVTISLMGLLFFEGAALADESVNATFSARGFDPERIVLPADGDSFPLERLGEVTFTNVANFDGFPEGPSYRPSDGRYFFAGNAALTRVEPSGATHQILGKPGGGGTHFLPDGSVLLIGAAGLRRLYPDGRIALLADGETIGGGNDLTMGRYGEIYFSVPKEGVYRLTPGKNGRLEKVIRKGCNGLEIDPGGEYLYTVRRHVERYRITGVDHPVGEAETIIELPPGEGGGDGCTFDIWGNLYSVNFGKGVIRVYDPKKRERIAEIPVGVVPASNLTFGGPANTELFVTAGAPKFKNCQVLKAEIGITGFCGHAGATDYPELRLLEETADPKAFVASEKDE